MEDFFQILCSSQNVQTLSSKTLYSAHISSNLSAYSECLLYFETKMINNLNFLAWICFGIGFRPNPNIMPLIKIRFFRPIKLYLF